MSDPRHDLGRAAEAAVARWLASHRWTVLARRLRMPDGGEVDIVARDPDGVLVAVEVRARRTARTGTADVTVDERKVRRLRRTLAAFARSDASRKGLRVDLVTVVPAPAGGPDGTMGWTARRIPGIDAW